MADVLPSSSSYSLAERCCGFAVVHAKEAVSLADARLTASCAVCYAAGYAALLAACPTFEAFWQGRLIPGACVDTLPFIRSVRTKRTAAAKDLMPDELFYRIRWGHATAAHAATVMSAATPATGFCCYTASLSLTMRDLTCSSPGMDAAAAQVVMQWLSRTTPPGAAFGCISA